MSTDNERFQIYNELVLKRFVFLETKFGFAPPKVEVCDGQVFIRYISSKTYVVLIYGRPSYELDFHVGRKGIDDRQNRHDVTSGDLLYLASKNSPRIDYKLVMAHSMSNLYSGVDNLATILECNGDECLKGVSSAYEEIFFRRKMDLNTWNMKIRNDQFRKSAEEAWFNKDYYQVVSCYESVTGDLKPSEAKKLELAQKKIR